MFSLLATLSWAVACDGPTELASEGYSGPHFHGRVIMNDVVVAGATIKGRTYLDDDCEDGNLFTQAMTSTDEAGEYVLYLDGLTGWSGGVGSEITVVCAELTAESALGSDTVVVQGISVRFLKADTLTQDFNLR